MLRSVVTAVVDDAALAEALEPRSGVVLERRLDDADDAVSDGPTGHRQRAEFEISSGPVRDYVRIVEWTTLDDGRHQLRQSMRARHVLRYWWWVFHAPLWFHLRRLDRPTARPFWAPPDPIDGRTTDILDLTCASSFVVGFVATLITQTATFAADEFMVGEAAQGDALAATRIASLIALPMVALADRRGRRRVVVVALVLTPFVAASGAVAPSMAVLAVTQTLARALVTVIAIAMAVLLAEELPAGSRAYGVSLSSMAGAMGVGWVLITLPLADTSTTGWRWVYVASLLFVPLAWDFWRRLPESKRFSATHVEATLRGHGGRLALLAVSGLLVATFGAPASQFQNEFLRDDLGFDGGRIALFTIATNIPGGIGIFVGARLAEHARRPVGAVGLVGGTLATVAMFASAGFGVWAWSVTGAIVGAVTIPALGVYGPELFPTSLRAKVNGIISVVSVVGSVIGLVTVGRLAESWGSFGPVFAVMSVGPLLLAVLVLVAYPETAHRTLEELNPEDEPPPLVVPGGVAGAGPSMTT